MTVTIQDRYIGIHSIEEELSYVNDDKRTPICASDIAQFIDEYYSEMFEGIASDIKAYRGFNLSVYLMAYYSYTEIAEDFYADETNEPYNPMHVLALNHGYDSIAEFERDYTVICDNAIDGFLVIG